MTDIVDKTTRSRMMSGIRSKNTKPEIAVRKKLHARGYRFRLHPANLPGHPDIVLPKYKVAIFVHGCFWHRHPGCKYTTTPATRPDFWQSKFARNRERDKKNHKALHELGWRIFTVWECGTKHNLDNLIEELIIAIADPRIIDINFPKQSFMQKKC